MKDFFRYYFEKQFITNDSLLDQRSQAVYAKSLRVHFRRILLGCKSEIVQIS